MSNEYVTAQQLKATLEVTNETFADADITSALTAASRAIDKLCGQRFYTAEETRYYTATNNVRLYVRDLISATTIKTAPNGDSNFSDTWTANTDYNLEPLNPQAGEPYRWLTRHPFGNFYFPSYPRSIEIVGTFGWSEPPPEVIDATTMLASRLLRRKREAPFGVVSVGIDVGAITHISRFDPDVAMLLQPYMDAPFA